jgi:hypothetical protein
MDAYLGGKKFKIKWSTYIKTTLLFLQRLYLPYFPYTIGD